MKTSIPLRIEVFLFNEDYISKIKRGNKHPFIPNTTTNQDL
ncbi:hypothetical protein [uncultured Aquimarina sp.]|nr:hypothetical protein [uncultured Aquimarina sp.]